MSIICGFPLLECVYCLGCARWVWKRSLHTGNRDSETWGTASAVEFEPVPRLCRLIMAIYEEDLENPCHHPPGGYGTRGRAPPYLIYLDHRNSDIVVAIRGLNLGKESDYAILVDNRLGKKQIYGGYVHNGLLKASAWILDVEGEMLKESLAEYPDYTLTFAGHSLGSGVAALLTMLVVHNGERLGDVERKRVRCFAMAPARCMSLSLALAYADVIFSVVLQDDFLPRTATPLEDIFKSICLRDTCVPEEIKYKDPRRLYAPGRIYHIIERKPFRWGRLPPVVRTGVPVEGRFEHIVPSCNATSDHAIVWIERQSQKLWMRKGAAMEIPPAQRIERQETIVRDHKDEQRAALRRAVTLDVPHAVSPSAYGTFDGAHAAAAAPGSEKMSWQELIRRVREIDGDSVHT
ncbi:unnamed protein product [Spirodela intermedia]|uniref:Uncharacterized protein n=1 Tax=Spirodela intermedia TaxID=51605 RepID=A0A7I8IXS0_SPIIN|nr:unnamed protein product [Spirodela intermedia]CAA6662648.1 unnamed protein product [Spirodela intermedia]